MNLSTYPEIERYIEATKFCVEEGLYDEDKETLIDIIKNLLECTDGLRDTNRTLDRDLDEAQRSLERVNASLSTINLLAIEQSKKLEEMSRWLEAHKRTLER